ncbi:MAG: hypothetical protein LBE18_12735 [Planctomycetaceae bacterium]|jgi:hypothetical protein|nr:hypothetical protein [Planctomycetaceae bacterium]
MNVNEKVLCHKQFKLLIYESNGSAFEQLFTKIMNYCEPEFQQIKPWGNIGDRKCDGRISSKGIYYQVYSPENPDNQYPDTIKKLKIDFIGLQEHWSDIQEYYFVFNDKFLGINADCLKAIDEIKKKYHLRNAGFITAKELENKLFQLEDDKILAIISVPNPADITVLEFSVLDEIIKIILDFPSNTNTDDNMNLPDWNEKIQFNGLSEVTKTFLNNAALWLHQLNKYLDRHADFLAEELCKKMRELYQTEKKNYSQDELFLKMIQKMIPKQTKTFQDAAIVIIAKYFETCDVFEPPIKDTQLMMNFKLLSL